MTTTITSPAVASIATTADIDRAVMALTLAFSTDPVARWMYGGDPSAYLTHFPAFVRAFGGEAFAAGTAYGAGDGSGVALWLPPGAHVDGAAVDALLERTLAPERYAAIGAALDQMARHHPDAPHWYLPLLGVDTAHQNQGHGAMLLEHALWQCDRDHVAAYLESTNPRNISLYRRHGFEVVGTIAVSSTCSITPMVRHAR